MSVESGPRQRSVERERERSAKKANRPFDDGHVRSRAVLECCERERGEREPIWLQHRSHFSHSAQGQKSLTEAEGQRAMVARARAPGPNPNPQVKYDDLSGVAPQTDRQTGNCGGMGIISSPFNGGSVCARQTGAASPWAYRDQSV